VVTTLQHISDTRLLSVDLHNPSGERALVPTLDLQDARGRPARIPGASEVVLDCVGEGADASEVGKRDSR